MWLLLFSCAPAPADAYLAYVRSADGYDVAPRSLPDLDDPTTMVGGLGEIRSGGRLVLTPQGDFEYDPGGPLDVRYKVVDGVAWPMDADGLILFSFWGHLGDAVAALDAAGLPLDEILPVDMAWVPSLPDALFELFPAENAAYATGGNLFVLLPDGRGEGVPLLANSGVVAHETGHALFQLLTTGDPYAPAAWDESDPVGGNYQAALHEGFADTVAALLLDDPRFLDPSISADDRHLDGTSSLTDPAVERPEDFEPQDLLAIYNPYPLGTVFASLAWDIRQINDDPEATLALAGEAAEAWSDGLQNGWSDEDRFSYASALLAGTTAEARPLACDAAALRLPGVELAPCSR